MAAQLRTVLFHLRRRLAAGRCVRPGLAGVVRGRHARSPVVLVAATAVADAADAASASAPVRPRTAAPRLPLRTRLVAHVRGREYTEPSRTRRRSPAPVTNTAQPVYQQGAHPQHQAAHVTVHARATPPAPSRESSLAQREPPEPHTATPTRSTEPDAPSTHPPMHHGRRTGADPLPSPPDASSARTAPSLAYGRHRQ